MTRKGTIPRLENVNNAALRFLRGLTGQFPVFEGQVVDTYTLKFRLDDVLAHRNMGKDTVTVSDMTVDQENREFGATIVPQDGCCFLRMSHVGIPVQGTRDGHIYTIAEIIQISSMQPGSIRSVGPCKSGFAMVELTQPIVMSAKCPADTMRAALTRVCQAAAGPATDADTADMTETEQALQAAESALQKEADRLRGKGKSMIEVETATQGLRDTINRLRAEVQEEALADGPDPAPPIVNPDAPFADAGSGMNLAQVQDKLKAWAAGRIVITVSDLYGTAPGLEPAARLIKVEDTDRGEVQHLLGHVIEHTLTEIGYVGAEQDGLLHYVMPTAKGVQGNVDGAPIPAIDEPGAPSEPVAVPAESAQPDLL